MRSEGCGTWSVCLCVCVCYSTSHDYRATNDTNLLSGGWRSKVLSNFLWKCFVAKLERYLLVRLYDKSAIFIPRKTRMRMNLDHVANGHFVLGRDVLCEFDYWPLAVSLQQRYARCPFAAPRVWHFSAFHCERKRKVKRGRPGTEARYFSLALPVPRRSDSGGFSKLLHKLL